MSELDKQLRIDQLETAKKALNGISFTDVVDIEVGVRNFVEDSVEDKGTTRVTIDIEFYT